MLKYHVLNTGVKSLFGEPDTQQLYYQQLSVLCHMLTGTLVLFCFQYIQQNIRHEIKNIDFILEAPEGQDEGVWKYEHLR